MQRSGDAGLLASTTLALSDVDRGSRVNFEPCPEQVPPRETMDQNPRKGLFLCGQMLDAFGPIGGYNFLWAWATGRAAGLAHLHRSRRLNRGPP
jgi:hypothetical protein